MLIRNTDNLQLRTDYKNQFNVSANCTNYFGDSNGYKIVGISDSDMLFEAEDEVIIGDMRIWVHSMSINIFAYKDNHFIPIVDAFNNGLLDKEDIEFIAEFSYSDMNEFDYKVV